MGAYLALTGRGLTAGAVVLFGQDLMNFVIEPVASLPGMLASRKAALGLVGELADALEANPARQGGVALSRLEKEIRLEDVRFSYDGEKQVLKGVSARLEAGRAYAVVGGKRQREIHPAEPAHGRGRRFSGQNFPGRPGYSGNCPRIPVQNNFRHPAKRVYLQRLYSG